MVSGKCRPTAKSQWRCSICWYQWKQSCRYALLFADLSPLFLPHSSARFSAFYQPLTTSLWILSRIPPRVFSTRINLSAWTTDTQHSRSASIFLLLSSSICSRVERGKLLLFTDSTFLAFLELEWRLWTTRMVATESFLSSAIFCLFVLWEERIFGSIVFRNAYARLNLG